MLTAMNNGTHALKNYLDVSQNIKRGISTGLNNSAPRYMLKKN